MEGARVSGEWLKFSCEFMAVGSRPASRGNIWLITRLPAVLYERNMLHGEYRIYYDDDDEIDLYCWWTDSHLYCNFGACCAGRRWERGTVATAAFNKVIHDLNARECT